MKKILCKLNLHNFKYYSENMKCDGLKHIENINVPIRECKWCGIREHHLMPKINLNEIKWKPYHYKKGETIQLEKIQ